ncbi:MAG TPA: hypothetical protein VEL11_18160 [Candidatus Bathyarchaeia archaeon]|nr:hypothetical protein [Candidatus Bathyarchaeia archaeon]
MSKLIITVVSCLKRILIAAYWRQQIRRMSSCSSLLRSHEQNLERSGRKYLPLSKGTILLSLVMPILNAGAGASTPQVVSTTLGTNLNNFGTPAMF